MSAFVAVRQRESVAVLSDAAWFELDGRVGKIGTKIETLPGMSAVMVARAIALFDRGLTFCLPSLMVMQIAFSAGWCFDQLVAGFDAAIALAEKHHRAAFPDRATFDLALAGWSEGRGRPELYFWTNDAGCPDFEPRRLIERTFMFAGPQASPQALADAGWSDPEGEDDFAAGDGLAMLEAMRREPGPFMPWDHASASGSMVGGFAELATVTRDGVSREVIRTWPDVIGQPIDPMAIAA